MKNIIVLLVDTLRYDSTYLDSLETIPEIRESSSWFTECQTTHPYTSGALLSIFTGLYPYHYGAAGTFVNTLIPPDVTYLPSKLKSLGYTTKHKFDFIPFGHIYGFYRDIDLITYHTEPDPDTIQWCKVQDKPYYLFWHIGDVHTPYRFSYYDSEQMDIFNREVKPTVKRLVAENRDFFEEKFKRPINIIPEISDYDTTECYQLWQSYHPDYARQEYLQGVREFDKYRLRKIWNSIKNIPNTIVVFLADHGEEFIEGRPNHGYSLSRDLLHVPLAIRGLEYPKEISHKVSTVDILPTILQEIDPLYYGTVDSVHLLNPETRALYSERISPFMCFYTNQDFEIVEFVGKRQYRDLTIHLDQNIVDTQAIETRLRALGYLQ